MMRGLKDDAAGRRAYLKHLEERVVQEGEKAGRGLPEGQSLQSTLQRGWMFGSEAFKEKVLKLAGKALELRRWGGVGGTSSATGGGDLEIGPEVVRPGPRRAGGPAAPGLATTASTSGTSFEGSSHR